MTLRRITGIWTPIRTTGVPSVLFLRITRDRDGSGPAGRTASAEVQPPNAERDNGIIIAHWDITPTAL